MKKDMKGRLYYDFIKGKIKNKNVNWIKKKEFYKGKSGYVR